MTWSILGRDDEGRLGVAVASRFFAVGALCPHTRRSVGAVSSQALLNPLYGPAALDRLAEGRSAVDIARALTDADPGRAQRQLHLLPARGAPVAFTGERCVEWCGHLLAEDFSVAGNMLAGPEVIEASAAAYREARAWPLAERLLAALEAGEAATSAASRPRRSSSTEAKTGANSTCASTTTPSPWPSCAASTLSASSASNRSSPALPAAATQPA
jgi:uncharacterized Ntn-hydrolase superfamily protein